jgi:transposase InsO family protein
VRKKHRTKAGCQHRILQAASGGYGPESAVDYGFYERVRWRNGRRFRILTVVDQFTREMYVFGGRSVPPCGTRVTQALEPVVAQRGAPRAITVDNRINV